MVLRWDLKIVRHDIQLQDNFRINQLGFEPYQKRKPEILSDKNYTLFYKQLASKRIDEIHGVADRREDENELKESS